MPDTLRWSEMRPIQRNALIAEHIFGWQWIPYTFYDVSSTDDQLWLLPNGEAVVRLSPGEWTYDEEDSEGNRVGNRFIPYWIPHYADSLDAAWQVVESHKFMDVKLEYTEGWHSDTERWQAYTCTVSPYDKPGVVSASWNTMPEAICIAALRAIGATIEE